MIIYFLPYLLFSIPLGVELVTDYRRIVIKHKVDNHFEDTMMRGALLLSIAMMDHFISGVHMWQSILIGIAWYWLVFDYAINYITKHHWAYLGKTSWLDKRINWLPGYIVLIMKLVFMLFAISLYYPQLNWLTVPQ